MPQIGFEANGDMGAYDGCNYRSGTFSVSEDRITFGSSGASTTKACENDPVSAAFDAVLSEHSTFKIEAQELTLTAPNGATLIFEADS